MENSNPPSLDMELIIQLINELVIPKFRDDGIIECISIKDGDDYLPNYLPTGHHILLFTFRSDKVFIKKLDLLRFELVTLFKLLDEYDKYSGRFFWVTTELTL